MRRKAPISPDDSKAVPEAPLSRQSRKSPAPARAGDNPAPARAGDAAALKLTDRLADRLAGLFLGILLRLPYERRIATTGWLTGHVIGPLSPMRRRIRKNLAHVFPDMPRDEVRRLCRAVPDNVGRSFIEMFSGAEFVRRAAATPIEGLGYAAMIEAHEAGRPVILVTGHFGNYEAGRAALLARGMALGTLFKPMKNAAINRRYVAAIEANGKPMFPKDRAGMASMMRFLREGGVLAMAIDQFNRGGVPLDFLGKPAPTVLTAAELALKHDALLVPGYAIRQPDGLRFRMVIEAPIPHGDPRVMTQALNDSLAAQVRENMDQWFWLHRRWVKH